MIRMLEDYAKRKRALEQGIASVQEVVSGQAAEKSLRKLKDKLENNIFHLAVLGQFKRGKTSFINALISESLLPTAIVPHTSIITVIRYGEKVAVKVVFLDKKEKMISLDELHLYVTEKDNPKNKKEVMIVEINYPSDYLKEGILLIDTPGIGSTFLHNTQMTYDYLEKIDAAIFLLSADPPISQNELDFLRDIRRFIPKIFFVLNKIDYLEEKDIDEISQFNEGILKKELGIGTMIIPLSAKLALEAKQKKDAQKLQKSRMGGFEKMLSRFFMHEKGDVMLLSVQNSLMRLIDEAVGFCELEIKSIRMPLKDAEERLEQFRTTAEGIRKEQEDAEPIIKAEIARTMEMVDEDLEDFKEKESPRLMSELRERFDSLKDAPRGEIVVQVQKSYLSLIEELFEPWRAKEERKVKERFERTAGRFSEASNKAMEKIKELSSELFSVDIPHLPTQDTFTLESRLYYRVDEVFSQLGDELKLLLPGFAYRKMLWNKLSKNIHQHLDMNSGRIRHDFLERLNNSSMKFIEILNERIDNVIGSIGQAIKKGIEERESSKKDVDELIDDLNQKIAMMKFVRDKIAPG